MMAPPKTSRIRRNYNYLKLLSNLTPCRQKAILKNADKDLVDTFSECALNLIAGNVNLPHESRNKIAKHRATIRQLASKRVSRDKKRKILIQRGGFLGAILPTIIGIIGSLFNQ